MEAGSGTTNVTIKGYTNNVYGTSGNNTIVSNTGSNNFISGFGDADNAQSLLLKPSETKILNINGVSYEVTNQRGYSNALLYSVNPVTGEISFASKQLIIKGQKDAVHNVHMYGMNSNFYGGDKEDNIILEAGYNISGYGEGGNDTLIIQKNASSSKVWGGDGDDNLEINNSGND